MHEVVQSERGPHAVHIGIYVDTHIVMVNKQNGRSSEMKISKIQLRADVPDDYFTTRYLERQ